MTTALRSTLAAVALLALLATCTTPSEEPMAAADGPMAPVFEVDPLWPKPLPNHWLLGTVIGVDVDDQDNVWIVHRGSSLEPKELYATWDPPASYCCLAARICINSERLPSWQAYS